VSQITGLSWQTQEFAGNCLGVMPQKMCPAIWIQIQTIRETGSSLVQVTGYDVSQEPDYGLCIRYRMEVNHSEKKRIVRRGDQKPERTEPSCVVEGQIQLSFDFTYQSAPRALITSNGSDLAGRGTVQILKSETLAVQVQPGEAAVRQRSVDAGLQAVGIQCTGNLDHVDRTVRMHLVPLQHALLHRVHSTLHIRESRPKKPVLIDYDIEMDLRVNSVAPEVPCSPLSMRMNRGGSLPQR
jgi:hypothetical protein